VGKQFVISYICFLFFHKIRSWR